MQLVIMWVIKQSGQVLPLAMIRRPSHMNLSPEQDAPLRSWGFCYPCLV